MNRLFVDLLIKVYNILENKLPNYSKYKILKKLNKKDQIKFVVKDQKDYDYAKQIIVKEKFQAEIIMQPVFGTKISIIADLVLKDNLPVRVLPQLHKSIWGDKRGV